MNKGSCVGYQLITLIKKIWIGKRREGEGEGEGGEKRRLRPFFRKGE
jgi:hypothetical protein